MKLWLLKPISSQAPEWGYDCAYGFVVRAETESVARALASEGCGDEGAEVWMNPDKVRCERLTATGPAGVILTDFAAG